MELNKSFFSSKWHGPAETKLVPSYLFKNLGKYAIVTYFIKGDFSSKVYFKKIRDDIPGDVFLLLGSIFPDELSNINYFKIIQIINAHIETDIKLIRPEQVSLILDSISEGLVEAKEKKKKLFLLGDFLDNCLFEIDTKTLYTFSSNLKMQIKRFKTILFSIVHQDLHSKDKLEVLKHFSEVIITIELNKCKMVDRIRGLKNEWKGVF
jgi:hypothetical protein